VLKLALAPNYAAREADKATKRLLAQSSLVSRKYNSSYALWEGSDIDLDERFRSARDRIAPETTTAELATRFMDHRPLVARRHSFETGSLRYFDVRFVSPHDLMPDAGPAGNGADGHVSIVLPENQDGRELALKAVKSPDMRGRNDLLWALPTNVQPLADAIRETACLEWIKDNTPELEGDRTARLELRARHADLQRKVASALAGSWHPRPTRQMTASGTTTAENSGSNRVVNSTSSSREWLTKSTRRRRRFETSLSIDRKYRLPQSRLDAT
jgi:hypothetical protein